MAFLPFQKGEFQKATATTVGTLPVKTSVVNVAQTKYGQGKK